MAFRSQDLVSTCAHWYWAVIASRTSLGPELENTHNRTHSCPHLFLFLYIRKLWVHTNISDSNPKPQGLFSLLFPHRVHSHFLSFHICSFPAFDGCFVVMKNDLICQIYTPKHLPNSRAWNKQFTYKQFWGKKNSSNRSCTSSLSLRFFKINSLKTKPKTNKPKKPSNQDFPLWHSGKKSD